MLVLSRRLNEKVLFPALGISVEVINVARNVVRLGIDAPPSVSVVREEIASAAQVLAVSTPKAARHRLRNRLHTARLGVHLAQKQLEAGQLEAAQATLNEALERFAQLDQELTAQKAERPVNRQIRALLVEDNTNESQLLAEFLRLHGISVATASDGQAALDYLRSHDRPDVVLLDMRMPRFDGPAVVAALRGELQYQDMKVFAVTGADPQECAVPVGADGVDGWFTKPLNPVKLVDAMKVALSRN